MSNEGRGGRGLGRGQAVGSKGGLPEQVYEGVEGKVIKCTRTR
jgi:hypothetical protein